MIKWKAMMALTLWACGIYGNGQSVEPDKAELKTLKNINMNKMKVEIWSDVLCPFCYIGKRNFEAALAQFPEKDHIEVEWKSFQLDPSASEVAVESQEDYLVKRKGMSPEQVKGMLANITDMAKQIGLEYRFEKSLVVNSQKAHRLIQFAKEKNLGNEIEERLFKAYFTEGKNIADLSVLTQLGQEIGLDQKELQVAFTNEQFYHKMQQDIQEAQKIGVNGVPFFVLDRKYAVSGAQTPQAFLQTLTQSFTEWEKDNPEVLLQVTKGQSCTPAGKCD